MERFRQSEKEVLDSLSNLESSWKDEHSQKVIELLEQIPVKESYGPQDISELLEKDFRVALTVIRLFLDLSKDELEVETRSHFKGKPFGSKLFANEPKEILDFFSQLCLYEKMTSMVNRPLTWYDVLVERLKAGRGSAIKGQLRGRMLEDFVEEIVKSIFGDKYNVRCQFTGARGDSSEKADFAIPSKQDPCILIEVKAYGATGSKQTDVLGDFRRIIEEKRHDTTLLLVTDGVTWRARANDLRKLITLQNQGTIARIYTLNMKDELIRDLQQLKRDYNV